MAHIEADGTVNPTRIFSEAGGSGLIARVVTTYVALVTTFGLPDRQLDGKPDVFFGWRIATPFGHVRLYDFEADVRREAGYWHHEHAHNLERYSVAGHNGDERASAQAFATVVLALARAGHNITID